MEETTYKVNFDICQETGCSLTITGASEYSDTSELGQNNYRYEDCVTINVLTLKKTNSDESIYSVVSHSCSNPQLQQINPNVDTVITSDIDTITLSKDGHYVVHHIIIPILTPEDFNTYNIELSTDYYWYADEKIYHKDGDTIEEIKLEGILDLLKADNNIRFACKDIFVLCHLEECFVNHCKEVFNNLYTFQCSKKSSKVDTFNRDLLWMTINVIKYYIEQGNYSLAQSLLEEFENCGGTICKQSSTTKTTSNGCGCSK